MVRMKSPPGRRARDGGQDTHQDGDDNGFLGEHHYIQALGAHNMEGEQSGSVMAIRVWFTLAWSLKLGEDISTIEPHHMVWLCRRWRCGVQSGWIFYLHLSESQTWTQHGSDGWEPPFYPSFIGAWFKTTFIFTHHFVLCLSLTASELARKTVSFSTTPAVEPSTPTRTGRSEFGTFIVLLLFSWCRTVFFYWCLFPRPEGWKQHTPESEYRNMASSYLDELPASPLFSLFCTAEEKSPVCFYNTPQAEEENNKWV